MRHVGSGRQSSKTGLFGVLSLFYAKFGECYPELTFNYNVSPMPEQGRWYAYGLFLPDDMLRKIYYENAARAKGCGLHALHSPLKPSLASAAYPNVPASNCCPDTSPSYFRFGHWQCDDCTLNGHDHRCPQLWSATDRRNDHSGLPRTCS
jgi:hypothetical protein